MQLRILHSEKADMTIMKRITRRLGVGHFLAFAAPFLVSLGLATAADSTRESEGEFLRVSETPGKHIALEIGTKTYVHTDGSRPEVALVSVAHIADAAFFEAVQTLLEEYDVVLFEAVRPAGARPPGGTSPEERIDTTRAAMRLVASIIEAYRQQHETTPTTLDSVNVFARGIHPLLGNWCRAIQTDAWGNPLEYETDELGTTFRIRSFAADERRGGEGHGADLVISADDAVEPLELSADGLQTQLAHALGLEFQLTALQYDAAHWRSSDMDMPTLAAAFQERGLDFAPLGDSLAGTSLPAQITKFLLGAVKMLDGFSGGAISDTMKVLMIEMLSDESIVEASMSQFGEGFGEVIIDERNQVVIDDLVAIINHEPGIDSVAILYGAAHMPDFEDRLRGQLGYEADGRVQWIPAITVDLEESQVNAAQLHQLRTMVRRMLRQQLRRSAP